MLERVKIRLGLEGSEKDELLNILISQAESTIINYTGRNDVPIQLFNIVEELTVIGYNRTGSEGEQGRSEGAIKRTFENIPEHLLAQIERFKILPKAKVMGV